MNEFYKCEFCGCETNARVRACCEKGQNADSEKYKKTSPEAELPPEEKNSLEKECEAYHEWYAGLTLEEQERYWKEVKDAAMRFGFYDY